MARPQVKTSGRRKVRWAVAVPGVALVALAAGHRMLSSSPAPARARAPSAAAAPTGGGGAGTPRVELPPLPVNWLGTPPSRDLFDVAAVFPPPEKPAPVAPVVPVPATAPAVDPRAQAVADARERVRLQATMQGPVPLAIINGQTHRAGDVIGGFTVRSIGDRNVVIERAGILLSLTCE